MSSVLAFYYPMTIALYVPAAMFDELFILIVAELVPWIISQKTSAPLDTSYTDILASVGMLDNDHVQTPPLAVNAGLVAVDFFAIPLTYADNFAGVTIVWSFVPAFICAVVAIAAIPAVDSVACAGAADISTYVEPLQRYVLFSYADPDSTTT